MGLDNVFSQFRVIVHRFKHAKQKKTQDLLCKRATELMRRSNIAQFFKNPVVESWIQKLDNATKSVRIQCNAVCAQRIRRTEQICSLHKLLYGDTLFTRLISKLKLTFPRVSGRSWTRLPYMSAAAFFSWQQQTIKDEEIERCIEDMKKIESADHSNVDVAYMDDWELVVTREDFKVWRKPLEGTQLFQYKMYGTYNDVCPRAMFQIQEDLEYRKTWDNNLIDLNVVDVDPKSGSEVIHWVTYYPYPMYSRDYVYVRRCKVDADKNIMIVVGRSVEHHKVPEAKRYVRVVAYEATMVIKPHTTFNENGLDYVLTYYDDPQASIPSVAYEWMASKGVPGYVDKIRMAAKKLQETHPNIQRVKDSKSSDGYNVSNPIPQ